MFSLGLLPWQYLLLAYCAGLLASHYLWPAIFYFSILLFSSCQLRIGALKARCQHKGLISDLTRAGFVVFVFVLGLVQGFFWLSENIEDCPIDGRHKLCLTGRIERFTPLWAKRARLVVGQAEIETGNGKLVLGKVLLTWDHPGRILFPGQVVRTDVKLRPIRGYLNPGGFERRFYWCRQGIYLRGYVKGQGAIAVLKGCGSSAARIREAMKDRLVQAMPPGPGQGLLLALLFGDRSLLSYKARDLLQRAGLAHILALSGLHLGLFLILGWVLSWLVGVICPGIYLQLPRPKLALVFMIPMSVFYLYLGDFRPSLVRAFLMFLAAGMAYWQGRRNFFLDGFFFALAVIVCLDPLAVFDLSLELSFLAVGGMILGQPLLKQASMFCSRLPGRMGHVLRYFVLLFGCSLLAFIFLLPLLQLVFARISFHLYWNLLWIPVIGFLVLPLGFLALGLVQMSFVWPLGELICKFLNQILSSLYKILLVMDKQDLLRPAVCMRPHWLSCLGYWWLLVMGMFLWHAYLFVRSEEQFDRIAARVLPCWVLALVLLVAPLLERSLVRAPGPQMAIIDVGQGQSLFFTDLQGRRYLVDGGGSWLRDYDLGRLVLAPVLTWQAPPRLAKVILSHPDFDHLRGLFYILDNFQVGEFVFNGHWPQGDDGQKLKVILQKRRIPVAEWSKGRKVDLGEGLELEVLHPPTGELCQKENNCSLVLRLSWNGAGLALMPGDVENPVLSALLFAEKKRGVNLRAQVLVLPHHGSRYSCLPKFYQAVRPELAVASLGANNPFHFPHKEVCQVLEARHIPLLTTARRGQITILWLRGGTGLRVETQEEGQISLVGRNCQSVSKTPLAPGW